ncbi:glycoside hydrolase family 25 [Caudovirales GX15bay]|nr:glycoside hydrolase family 25 [Caudovirales GX15bay]
MRDVAPIWDAWDSGGPYVGDRKPQTRVTVQRGWRLSTSGAVLGTWNKGPARWYVEADHDLNSESELPNVVSVNMERSLDSDAGSCDIVLANTATPALGDPELPSGQFGVIGSLMPDYGSSQDAKARWGHAPNQWRDVFAPNAVLRTYQGFGGEDKPLDQALADGNVVLNGVWLVDSIDASTEGTISIKCRDMAKLLVVQQLFPPLVPEDRYPLTYRRWIYTTTTIPASESGGSTCYNDTSYGFTDPTFSAKYPSSIWHSSTDEVYGQYNTAATGHPPAEAFDISYEPATAEQLRTPGYLAHQRSYWLSESKGAAGDDVWIEMAFQNGESRKTNSIYYHGKGDHYFVKVSIFENGEWVAPETPQGGFTPAGIPFVGTIDTAPELPAAADSNRRPLPRTYNASRIRLTLTNLKYDSGGYRAGARKIMACYDETSSAGPLVFAAAGIPPGGSVPQRIGYWQVQANGQVYAFGDARTYPTNSPANTPREVVMAMAVHPGGEGYWVVDNTGRVLSAGQAEHLGDLEGYGHTDVVDIAPSPTGDGYWLLTKTGEVYTYGDATYHGNSTHTATMPSGVPAVARSIESHPATQGYWVAWTDGWVEAFNLTHYGHATDRTGFTTAEYVTAIRRTSTGDGYWVLSGGGHVQNFGDAVDLGDASTSGYAPQDWFKALTWDLIPSSKDDLGYGVVHADGKITTLGFAEFTYGSVGEGVARQRFDGDYKDYVDIVRDLVLWGGFYLHRDPQPTAQLPDVYGNLESTGAWSDDDLPADMFDKRPVIDAIKQIRDIVGFVVYCDAEGGIRFESPNWWTMGNYLIDGTPYTRMPEIDEKVTLTSLSVTRSDTSSRSKIIVANSNPLPTIAGKPPATGVISTEIVPRTAVDLRGLQVPAMWTNGAFLRKFDQKNLAELVDLKAWFARRMASVTCVANPLIDINDQVRIVERQTGEVYTHYIRSLSTSHDLQAGTFTMTLNTHWLGGAPFGVNGLYRAGDARPQGDGHWLATFGGYTTDWGTTDAGVYAYGDAPLFNRNEADSHLAVIIAMRTSPSGNGYYTLDQQGKILTYGDAVHRGQELRSAKDVIDMALTPSGEGYWVIRADGTVTTFGDAVDHGHPAASGTMTNGQPIRAEAIESHPSTTGYWVLMSDGTVHAYNVGYFGSANRDRLNPIEYFTSLRRTSNGNGYWVLSAGGVVQGFGNASELGDAERYPDANWVNGLCWTFIRGPGDTYAVVHADGATENFGFPSRSQATKGSDRFAYWPIVTDESAKQMPDASDLFTISDSLLQFLKNSGSRAAVNAAVGRFGAAPEDSTEGFNV